MKTEMSYMWRMHGLSPIRDGVSVPCAPPSEAEIDGMIYMIHYFGGHYSDSCSQRITYWLI